MKRDFVQTDSFCLKKSKHLVEDSETESTGGIWN